MGGRQGHRAPITGKTPQAEIGPETLLPRMARWIQAGPPTLPHAGRPQRFSELEARIKDDTLLHLT